MISVNETFYTIQGEGKNIGIPSIFIRLSGCNLRCSWCDTKYTWLFSEKTVESMKKRVPNELHYQFEDELYVKSEETHSKSISEIIEIINSYAGTNIVISGGEPLLQKENLQPLTEKLVQKQYSIEIETNGTISPVGMNKSIQFNVSPKLTTSHNPKEVRYKPDILRKFLDYKSYFKFVVTKKDDIKEIKNIINEIEIPHENIYLMPEGRTKNEINEKAKFLVPLCKDLNVNYSHRLHVELFGDKRGV